MLHCLSFVVVPTTGSSLLHAVWLVYVLICRIIATRDCASIAFGGDCTLVLAQVVQHVTVILRCVGGSLWRRICFMSCITCSVQCSGYIMKKVSYCVQCGMGTVLVTLSFYPNW